MLHLVDRGAASVLAEVPPLLLISLTVEFRHVGMHTRAGRRQLRLGLSTMPSRDRHTDEP